MPCHGDAIGLVGVQKLRCDLFYIFCHVLELLKLLKLAAYIVLWGGPASLAPFKPAANVEARKVGKSLFEER